MEKKGYGIALLFALGASVVLYLSAYLSALAFPSLEGILATLWSILLFAVIFAISVASRRFGERTMMREFTQDIVLDMIPPGRMEKFNMVVVVSCIGPKQQVVRLERNTTRRLVK
ncbi:MAG: hypothetical protein AAB487_00640 [Patescibacteria group bacterium]